MYRIRHKPTKTLLKGFLDDVPYKFTTSKEAKEVITSHKVVYDSGIPLPIKGSMYINSNSVPDSNHLVSPLDLEIVRTR